MENIVEYITEYSLADIIIAFLRTTGRIPEDLVNKAAGIVVNSDFGLVFYPLQQFSNEYFVTLLEKVYPKISEFNKTFHKSWDTIRGSNELWLWRQTARHYFTTYGIDQILAEHPELANGIVRVPQGYIPKELSLPPELNQFQIIETISDEEAIKILENVFYSGIALSQKTLEDYLAITLFVRFHPELSKIKNKELKTLYTARKKLIPRNPEEIIRLINYLLTDKTLLIQDSNLHEFSKIAAYGWGPFNTPAKWKYLQRILTTRKRELASVFFRYKQLLLVIKKFGFNTEVNRIRRLANKLWQPKTIEPPLSRRIMQSGYDEYLARIEALRTFDLIKIYNKLSYVEAANNYYGGEYYDIFTVRNGKYFILSSPRQITNKTTQNTQDACQKLKKLIKNRLNPNNQIKLILPEYLTLTLPTSEKSFIGNIPLYSQIEAPNGANVIGVSWKKDDVDLSAILGTGAKVGWNGLYKYQSDDQASQVLYSGDCTRGGAEALYFRGNMLALIMLNLYNFEQGELDFFIGTNSKQEFVQHLEGDYIVNPNKIVFSAHLDIKNRSQMLGYYRQYDGRSYFTFANLSHGKSHVSADHELRSITMDTLFLRGESALKLNDIYETMTAPKEGTSNIYDLRKLNKSTILKLVIGKSSDHQT